MTSRGELPEVFFPAIQPHCVQPVGSPSSSHGREGRRVTVGNAAGIQDETRRFDADHTPRLVLQAWDQQEVGKSRM